MLLMFPSFRNIKIKLNVLELKKIMTYNLY